jgi:hypothetical protein
VYLRVFSFRAAKITINNLSDSEKETPMYRIGLVIGGIIKFLQKSGKTLLLVAAIVGLLGVCAWLVIAQVIPIAQAAVADNKAQNAALAQFDQTSTASNWTPTPSLTPNPALQNTPTPSQVVNTEEVVVVDTSTPTATQAAPVSTQAVAVTAVSAAPVATFPATGWNPSGIDLALIEAREQIGGGMDIIGDWTNPNLSRQIVANPLDHVVVVPISSDKGSVKVYEADGTFRKEQPFSKGFIYVIALAPGDWFEITGVGYNSENGHRNTWCEAFVFPSDPTPADLAQILQEWQDREKKPQAASLWVDNTITWLANN